MARRCLRHSKSEQVRGGGLTYLVAGARFVGLRPCKHVPCMWGRMVSCARPRGCPGQPPRGPIDNRPAAYQTAPQTNTFARPRY